MYSSWPYHFVSLPPAEVQHRRDVLSLRGYYAQCSALVIIVSISIYRNQSRKDSVQRAVPSGSELEKTRVRGTGARSIPETDKPQFPTTNRSWWNMPPFHGWNETRKQYLLTLLWLAWLLSLSVWNTGDDYLHLTKALGHVALSQLPFQFLLSPTSFIFTSNPGLPSVLSVLSSIPQPTLTPYHRLFGRLIVLPLLFAHGILYLLFFAQSSHPDFGTLLVKRVQDPDVQWGLTGLVLAIGILLFSRPTPQRLGSQRRAVPSGIGAKRRTFYVVHLSLVAGLLAVAYFHVIYARAFVLEALGIAVANLGCCWAVAAGKRGIAKNPN